MKVESTLYESTKNPLLTIRRVLETCSGKKSTKSNYELGLMAYNLGHWSVFEFVNFTFDIKNLSRVALAQLTRHRIASYAVRTSRSEFVPAFSLPESLADYSADENNFKEFLEIAEQVGFDSARYFLPQAQTVDLLMSLNLRSLLNFMQERLCSRAGEEIRDLANKMKKNILKSSTIQDQKFFDEILQPKCSWLRRCPLGRNCKG
jgi:thymidylate synthase (FAD)